MKSIMFALWLGVFAAGGLLGICIGLIAVMVINAFYPISIDFAANLMSVSSFICAILFCAFVLMKVRRFQ